jgi:MarR family transcriptional regulator for hemolysin
VSQDRTEGDEVPPAEDSAATRADYFDPWVTRYHEFYPERSRLDLEYRTSRMLVLAGRSWMNRIDNILRVETGQTRARWQVLFALAFAEQPVTMTEICRRVRVQWPTMVRVIDGMVADGLLLRADNPGDGRSKLARLTPRGEEVMRQIQPILDRERSRILARLSTDELRLCTDLLNRIFEDAIEQTDDARL